MTLKWLTGATVSKSKVHGGSMQKQRLQSTITRKKTKSLHGHNLHPLHIHSQLLLLFLNVKQTPADAISKIWMTEHRLWHVAMWRFMLLIMILMHNSTNGLLLNSVCIDLLCESWFGSESPVSYCWQLKVITINISSNHPVLIIWNCLLNKWPLILLIEKLQPHAV